MCTLIADGPSDDAIISWSELYALYQLPDGTTWAEHGYFHDAEDVAGIASKLGLDSSTALPPDMGEQELLRRKGRCVGRACMHASVCAAA